MLIKIVNYLYNFIYDYLLGNKNNPLSTPTLYFKTCENIPENSRILDFGCGNGLPYTNKKLQHLLIKKNITIIGIDINTSYVKRCQSIITENNLDSYINVMEQDLLLYTTTDLFDYVIFSESAPLMKNEMIVDFVSYIYKNLLKQNGNIIFINNIMNQPTEFVKTCKPLIKYVSSVDFGRVITIDDFNAIAERVNKNVSYTKIDGMHVSTLFGIHNLYYLYKILNKIGLNDYMVEKFQIILTP